MAIDETIKDVNEVYAKHGWTLRRVLLSPDTYESSAEVVARTFPGAEIVESELDAAWYSRRSNPRNEAWELRRLSGTPFALVAVIPDGTSPEDFEETLAGVEERMLESKNRDLPTLENDPPLNGNN